MVVYVGHDTQTVTIPLLIPYWIPFTNYATTSYNVNNKQRKIQNIRNYCKYSEINKNNYNIPIVFVLNVVYTTISFTKRGNKYENG